MHCNYLQQPSVMGGGGSCLSFEESFLRPNRQKRLQWKWSCWMLVIQVVQDMLLLTKYRLDTFRFPISCFLVCLFCFLCLGAFLWNVCGQFIGSWVLSRSSDKEGPIMNWLLNGNLLLIGFRKRPVPVILFSLCLNPSSCLEPATCFVSSDEKHDLIYNISPHQSKAAAFVVIIAWLLIVLSQFVRVAATNVTNH